MRKKQFKNWWKNRGKIMLPFLSIYKLIFFLLFSSFKWSIFSMLLLVLVYAIWSIINGKFIHEKMEGKNKQIFFFCNQNYHKTHSIRLSNVLSNFLFLVAHTHTLTRKRPLLAWNYIQMWHNNNNNNNTVIDNKWKRWRENE